MPAREKQQRLWQCGLTTVLVRLAAPTLAFSINPFLIVGPNSIVSIQSSTGQKGVLYCWKEPYRHSLQFLQCFLSLHL
jgi:hypothetical protein